MNTSLIRVFSCYIFTQGTAVCRETGHPLQCKASKKVVLDSMYAAVFSQRLFILPQKHACTD
jgi:hypothetical protein